MASGTLELAAELTLYGSHGDMGFDAAGDEGSGLVATRKNMEAIAGFMGKPVKSLLVPFAPHEPGAILKDAGLKVKAMAFGAGLVDG